MGGLLVTLLVVALIVVLGALAVVLLAVGPFVTGVDMAERRGYSTDRWGALCLLGIAVAMILGYLVHGKDLPGLLYLPAAGLAWLVPGVLALMAPGQRLGGRQGLHEH